MFWMFSVVIVSRKGPLGMEGKKVVVIGRRRTGNGLNCLQCIGIALAEEQRHGIDCTGRRHPGDVEGSPDLDAGGHWVHVERVLGRSKGRESREDKG